MSEAQIKPVAYSATLDTVREKVKKTVSGVADTISSVSTIHHVGSESNVAAVSGSKSLATRAPQGLMDRQKR